MTLARYLLGVVLTVVALVPVCGGSWALRPRLLPRWSGAPARLAEAVLGLSVVIGVSELLGAVGLFRVAPMVIGLSGAREQRRGTSRVAVPGSRSTGASARPSPTSRA